MEMPSGNIDYRGVDRQGRECLCGLRKTTDRSGNECYRQSDYWLNDGQGNYTTQMECDNGYFYYKADEGALYRIPSDQVP